MSRQLIVFLVMISSSVAFAQDPELTTLREHLHQIEQKFPKSNSAMKREIQSVELRLKDILHSREKQNPTDEELDREVDARTLWITLEPVFEMNQKMNKKKCSKLVDDLEFNGTLGMDEGDVRPDYLMAIQILKKTCA